MRITALVENTSARPELIAEHALSLYIESKGYKILFDMRSDINDLKRMLSDLMHGAHAAHQPVQHEVIGLLPSSSVVPAEPDYTVGEVVEEVPHKELTKADMQREQIVRALKSNNGRRRDAARELFMSERTLYRRIKELGISEEDF